MTLQMPKSDFISVENIVATRQHMTESKDAWYKGKNINCVAGIDRFIRSCGGRTPLETFGLRRDAWEVSHADNSEKIWHPKNPKTSFKKIEPSDIVGYYPVKNKVPQPEKFILNPRFSGEFDASTISRSAP